MMERRGFLRGIAALGLAVSMVGVAAPAQPANAFTLMGAGDSIMLGVRPGVTVAQTYVAKIGAACGFSTVVNVAVGGEDTGQTLSHFATDLAAANPDTVFLASSPNDYAHGLTLAQSESNLLAMKTAAEATGAKVVFFAHLIWADGTYLHASTGAPGVRALMQKLGGMPGVQFVDVFAEQTRLMFYNSYVPGGANPWFASLYAPTSSGGPDYIHPSAIMHQYIADLAALNPAVCDHR